MKFLNWLGEVLLSVVFISAASTFAVVCAVLIIMLVKAAINL